MDNLLLVSGFIILIELVLVRIQIELILWTTIVSVIGYLAYLLSVMGGSNVIRVALSVITSLGTL